MLVVFIGGLALGAWLCARAAARLRNPLRLYAGVELAVGVLALEFHPIFVADTDWGYAESCSRPATCAPETLGVRDAVAASRRCSSRPSRSCSARPSRW